jgi:tetratricopeptide (TPR) repeat protein
MKEMLESLKPFVLPHMGDEVVYLDTGSTDDTDRQAKKWGCKVIRRPDLAKEGFADMIKKWLPDLYEDVKDEPQLKQGRTILDFAGARQIATDAAKNDLIFWIDTDDVLTGGDMLRALVPHFFEQMDRGALFLPYDYAFDPDGTCTTVLWRERLVRKKYYEWLGCCHETLLPRNRVPEPIAQCPHQEIRIIHKNHKFTKWSDVRNYVILRSAYENAKEAGGWLDPRWDFYLGNAMRGLEMWDEALKWYTRVLGRSGSKEDRFTAAMNIGTIYMIKNRQWRALDWFNQSEKIFPNEPRVWFAKARAYLELKKYTEAILYTEIGKGFPVPPVLTAVDPTGYDFYPDMFAARASQEIGRHDEALRYARQALQRRPDFDIAQELTKAIEQEGINAKVKEAIQITAEHASSIDCAKTIIQSLKPELRQGVRELQIEEKFDRDPKTITWLTGPTVEQWDGTSNGDGIGGSEKMVLLLSREFAARGYKVEVFGNPKEENLWKEIDGIEWKPYQAFNPASFYDTLVIWRIHEFSDLPLKANKVFFDLHDVQDPRHYVEGRMMKVDKYLFKSEYHTRTVKEILGDKALVTRNAIDVTHFTPEEPVVKDLKKVIFCSSGDRGLKETLRIWDRVVRGDPELHLHIFYGFTPFYRKHAADREYQYFGDERCDRHMLDYEEEIYQLVDKLPRVTLHGRVSHEELAKHLMESSIWLYPTTFEEISCMAAMEAQAAGAIPVVYPTGALEETVFVGHKCKTRDEACGAIRKIITLGHDLDDERFKMAAEAKERFDIKALATEWLELFSKE